MISFISPMITNTSNMTIKIFFLILDTAFRPKIIIKPTNRARDHFITTMISMIVMANSMMNFSIFFLLLSYQFGFNTNIIPHSGVFSNLCYLYSWSFFSWSYSSLFSLSFFICLLIYFFIHIISISWHCTFHFFGKTFSLI